MSYAVFFISLLLTLSSITGILICTYHVISKKKKRYYQLAALITILLLAAPFLINESYKANRGYTTLWNANDVIMYFASSLVFLGTMILGFVAVVQSNNATMISRNLLLLEERKRKPRFSAVNNQEYSIYLGDELYAYKKSIDMHNVLFMEPLFITNPRSGITTSVALMELEVENSGESDIMEIYIDEISFHLHTSQPNEQQRPLAIMGNCEMKKGDKRKLVIDFKQELLSLTDEVDDSVQIDWIINNAKWIMPHIEMKLRLITTDGAKYDEELTLSTSWYRPLKQDGLLLERVLGTRTEVNLAPDE